MSAVLSFAADACHSCFRPPNAGGVHNHGCLTDKHRYCPLCGSAHNFGDDVHRRRDSAFCSVDAAIERTVAECPGWSRHRCIEHVGALEFDLKTETDVVTWVRSNPTHIEVVKAAARGLRFAL